MTDYREDWPLAVFTVAVQVACGLALAATVVDFRSTPAEMAVFRPLAVAIFPVLAAGTLCSLLHVGRPLHAWRALANLRQSRLSMEVLLAVSFAFLALVYGACWWVDQTQARPALGVVASAVGLAAVVAGARVHMVPSQPIWNLGWLLASFAGTTTMLGGLAVVLFIPGQFGPRPVFLAAGVAGSVVLLISAIWISQALSRVVAAPLRTSRYLLWLVPHLALSGVFPIVLAFFLPLAAAPVRWTAFASILLGALAGRMLVYAVRDAIPQF